MIVVIRSRTRAYKDMMYERVERVEDSGDYQFDKRLVFEPGFRFPFLLVSTDFYDILEHGGGQGGW